jgi:CheY-like chemotaxis protein
MPILSDSLSSGAAERARSRVLVVDDDRPLTEMLRDVLIGEGYQVHAAPDGQRGIAAILAWHPHLVLLDVLMPFCTGPEVVAWMQQLPAGGRPLVILMTATSSDQLADLPVAGLIRKPFAIDTLLAQIDQQLLPALAQAS